MVPCTPRRRAVALLCAALMLVAVCARSASIIVSGDVSKSDNVFDGDSITFDLNSVSADVVTVQLLNSKVTGNGLSIQGYTGSVPSGVNTRVSMSIASTVVTDSTISMKGYLPSNSDIRLAATTGTLTAAQSLFDFSGLVLNGNVTVTVESTNVKWPSGSTNTGSIVTYSTGSTGVGISGKSSLFILNATATNGASVLHLDTSSVFSVTGNSVLAVDYSRCEGCSDAMVNVGVVLKVSSSSMFRITHGTVVKNDKGLLSSAGSFSLNDKSLYLISDSTIESGKFFTYSDTFTFAVADSTVSFLNLVGPSTGIAKDAAIPTTVDATSVIIAGSCTIGGTALTTADNYAENGLKVTKVVNKNGAIDGTCANAICVPGNSNAGTAEVPGTKCACSCSASTFNPPSCTTVSDPTQNYDGDTICKLDNCVICDRLYPDSQCTQCKSGYELTPSYKCKLAPTTTTTTTTAMCNVAYCEKCKPDNGSTCITCRNGYKLVSGSCIANFNGAATAQSALLAAAVCVAAVYTL